MVLEAAKVFFLSLALILAMLSIFAGTIWLMFWSFSFMGWFGVILGFAIGAAALNTIATWLTGGI